MKKKMQHAKSQFMNLVTCMSMYTNNFDAAVNVEYALKTDGTLVKTFNAYRFGNFNRDLFLEKHIPDALIYGLFHPVINVNYFEKIISQHIKNKATVSFLVEQFYAQEVWDAYFNYVESQYLFTAKSVETLKERLKENYLKPVLQRCTDRNKLYEEFISDNNDETFKVNSKITSVFKDVLPRTINIDDVPGDGDCFFTSMYNQFKEFLPELNPQVQRQHLQEYCFENLDYFASSVVTVWQTMYEVDKKSREWAFFRPYAHRTSPREIAKHMLRDEMFLKKSFFAEEFAMNVTIDYINELLNRRLMIIVLDVENGPSPVLGETPLGKENLYIFLIRHHEHYSSVEIEDQRIFMRKTLPAMHVNFV